MTKARPMQYEFSVQMRTSDISDEFKDATITWATPPGYQPIISNEPTPLTREQVTSIAFAFGGAYTHSQGVLRAGDLYRYTDELLNGLPAKFHMLEKTALTESSGYLVPYVNTKIASMLSKLAISGAADPLWGRIEATRLNLR
jgi:hypothetical protein